MTGFQAPPGTRDVLPPESARWEALVARFASLARRAGYGLLLNPLFEDVGVFRRGVGASSDIVTREMYEFEDKGGRQLALRPEGTASVVRSFVEHRPVVPWKVWYVTPAFRYEHAQAGRYRQHHQLGAEAIGTEDPDVDVEVVALLADLFASLGLSRVELRVNSMGDANCMPAYRAALVEYLAANEALLCDSHRTRWRLNPLRVLDCKSEGCVELREGAPRLADFWCDACREHFGRFKQGLTALGIAYQQDDFLVRGLDYYTRTTFEFAALALESSQNAIGGGGRYDGLVAELGGPPTPGIGFGSGIERILLACDAEGTWPVPAGRLDAFVVDLTGGEVARDLTHELRRDGFAVDRAFDSRSMKAQIRAADRSGAELALIVGEDELAEGTVTVRRLRDDGSDQDDFQGRQQSVKRSELGAFLAKELAR